MSATLLLLYVCLTAPCYSIGDTLFIPIRDLSDSVPTSLYPSAVLVEDVHHPLLDKPIKRITLVPYPKSS